MYKKVLMGLLLILGISASAQDLSQSQIEKAERIYSIAKTAPNKNGVTYENTLLMIALQESFLGEYKIGDWKKNKSITTASLGVFQIRLETARHLQKLYPNELGWLENKTDLWLVGKLLSDDDFNLVVALLNMHRISESKLTQGNKFKIISMWNGGIYNPTYYSMVTRHKDRVSNLVNNF